MLEETAGDFCGVAGTPADSRGYAQEHAKSRINVEDYRKNLFKENNAEIYVQYEASHQVNTRDNAILEHKIASSDLVCSFKEK